MENDLIRRGDVLAMTAKRNNVWDIVTDASGRGLTKIVDSIPAVDAVEVVRCRECIRWQGKDDGNAAPCSWDWYNKDPDWYCPRGKHREDGDV